MKITIVLGAFFPVPPIMGGAVEKVWFALGQEFVRQGHDVVQISRRHKRLPKTEQIEGVTHLRVRGFAQPRSIVLLKFLDLIYSLRVLSVLPEADILVTNTFWLPILVRSSRKGLVCVNVQRGPKGQMRWYARASRLIAASNAIAEAIVAQAPELRDKVRVLPNPLPFRANNDPTIARDRTILFVGRIHPEKGIELLLRALATLPEKILSGWNVKIVGPHEAHLGGGGNYFLRTMQHLAKQIATRVEWLGPIFVEAQLAAHYRSALIFAYPSLAERGEAMPVAPLEAMANGCPPVVSDLACFRDYIDDSVTGIVFDHRAAEPEKELARRMSELMELGEAGIARLGQAARAKTAEFELQPVAQRYLDDFANLRETESTANKSD